MNTDEFPRELRNLMELASNCGSTRSYGAYQEEQNFGHLKHTFLRKCHNVKEFIFPTRVFLKIKHRIFGRVITELEQRLGQDLIDALDDSVVEDSNPDITSVPRLRMHFVSDLVAECKVTLPGITVENKANRLVAERWLGNRMRERGMRMRHIAQILPLAIEGVFIPDQYELQARALRQSHAVQNRVQQGQDVLYSRTKPWIGNWFGTRSRRPDPAPH
jgi:hypothetical protein